jgi:tetratricopeptide (TPR) repeat protein
MGMNKWTLLLGVASCCFPLAALAQIDNSFAVSYRLEAERRFEAAASSIQLLADSGDDFAQMRVAWLAYQAGNYNAAVNGYLQLLQRNPLTIEARQGLLLPLMAQERWQDAAAQARIILAQSPWDYTAHVRLLACEEGLKQWEALEAHAGAVSRAYPSDATALVYLARARAHRKNAVGAREAYGLVLARVPAHQEAIAFLKTAN